MVPGQWGGVLSAVARPLTDTFQHVAVYRSLEHWGVHLLASETPIPEMSPAEFSARLPAVAQRDFIEWVQANH